MPDLINSQSLAALRPQELAAAIRPLFEDSAWLAVKLAGRSFSDWDDLIDASEALLERATNTEKAEMLRSHPRLGGPQAELRKRSETSWREQGGGRDPGATVFEELSEANARYEARFGFPFVDWVAGRSLQQMTVVIDSRLSSDSSSELTRGCQALVDIARDRLKKIEGESECPSCS